MKKIIWIPAKNLWWAWFNIYISIYKTLSTNWYKCYFLQPNKLVKKYLEKAHIPKDNILESKIINSKYDWSHNQEFEELSIYIKTFFWKLFHKQILKEWIIEYHQYNELIQKYNINTILVYNWIFRTWKLAWLDNNCEVIYFENWYFPNTIQVDNKGINAESSISNISYENILNLKKGNNKIEDIEFYKENYDISFLRKLYLNIFSYSLLTSFYYTLFMIKKIFLNIIKNILLKFEKEIKLEKDWKYIFIAFQVHDDTQLIFNSKVIKKMDDILDFYYKDLKEILPEYKIVVKEHPMDIWRINYKYLQNKYPDIIWIKKWNIDDIIKKSEYIICTNSSVWLQALSKYKKVFSLWENFYSNNPWVEKLKNRNCFKEQLIELKNKELNKKNIDDYINIFKNVLFINGSWKWWAWENFDKKTIKEICEYIVK